MMKEREGTGERGVVDGETRREGFRKPVGVSSCERGDDRSGWKSLEMEQAKMSGFFISGKRKVRSSDQVGR